MTEEKKNAADRYAENINVLSMVFIKLGHSLEALYECKDIFDGHPSEQSHGIQNLIRETEKQRKSIVNRMSTLHKMIPDEEVENTLKNVEKILDERNPPAIS